jgi:hypothetical protein
MAEHYDDEPSRAEVMLASARAIAELQASHNKNWWTSLQRFKR